MAERSDILQLRRMVQAASDPLAMVVLAGATGVAVVTHVLPVVGLGAAAYVALVAWGLVGAKGGKDVAERGLPAPILLPEPNTLRDPATRDAVDALRAAQVEVRRVYGEAPESVRDVILPALNGLRELEQHAAVLAVRADELAAYLAGQDRGAIHQDAARLRGAQAATQDPSARAEFAAAASTRAEQLQTLDDIAAVRDRALANLARILSTMQGLPARIIRMQALEGATLDAATGDVGADLGRLNHEVGLFETTLLQLSEGTLS